MRPEVRSKTLVPLICFERPGDETSASTIVYALASLASSGQLPRKPKPIFALI